MPRKKPKDMVAVEVAEGEMDGVEPTTTKAKGTWETFMELEGIEDPKKKKKKKKKKGFLPTLVKQVMSIPAQYAKAEQEKRNKKGPRQYRKKAEFELNLHNPEHEEAWEYLEKLQMSKHDADLVFRCARTRVALLLLPLLFNLHTFNTSTHVVRESAARTCLARDPGRPPSPAHPPVRPPAPNHPSAHQTSGFAVRFVRSTLTTAAPSRDVSSTLGQASRSQRSPRRSSKCLTQTTAAR